MSFQLTDGRFKAFSNAGAALTGGMLYTYTSGTTTPKATYTSSTLAVPNANPVVLNSRGEAQVWLGTGSYTFELRDASNAFIWSVDGVQDPADVAKAYTDALQSSLAATTGAGLIGFQSGASGSQTQTLLQRISKIYLASDFPNVGAAASSTASEIIFQAGNYVATSTTFSMPVTFLPGATMTINTGVTVTFNGGITAGVYKIFTLSGTGAVVIGADKQKSGYAEWFGAISGSSGAAAGNVTAINQAIVALRKVELLPADYYINAQLTIGISDRELAGSGAQYDGSTSKLMTRIVNTSGSGNILQAGVSAYPGSIAAMPREIKVRDVMLCRSVAPVIASAGIGLYNSFAQYSEFINVRVENCMYAFSFYGTIQTYAERCFAYRSDAGSGGGTDIFRGFYVNGNYTVPGSFGGNQSLVLSRCNANSAVSITNSAGFYADVSFYDCLLDNPQTSACDYGIYVVGSVSTTLNNVNMQIRNPVLTGSKAVGLYVGSVNNYGGLEVFGGFIQPASTGTYGIYVLNCAGAVSIHGGQLAMVNVTSGVGLYVYGSQGTVCTDTQILESKVNGVRLESSTSCKLSPIIKNYANTMSGAAVNIQATSARCIIEPLIAGGATFFGTYGIDSVGANSYFEFRCSGIDPAALAGGLSANKLRINGSTVTTTGLSGTHLVAGVMA